MVSPYTPALLLALLLTLPATGSARTVKKIAIHEVGQSVDQSDVLMTESCKAFRPTVSQVKRYFSKAYPVEGYVFTTERYSPCYATGEVEFSDNSFGKFQLRSGGTALLFWNRGDVVTLLYKRNKWHDPFACAYGLDDKGEC